ncbi:MAG: 16S rRNA (guanine(966)-N(2))-methyltransferase RsmD [Acidimicrobiales bacterium]
MRVVAGEARGRRLVAPKGFDTRPTSDRVREAIFNMLTSMDAVDEAVVLDAFAGSGALGIEALSRGASRATFVERDRAALSIVRQNVETCGVGDRADVVAGDALSLLAAGRLAGPWDLALLDPPYAFDDWPAMLAGLDADVAVCESDRAIAMPVGWRLARTKHYGGTVVTICQSTRRRSAS